MKILLFGGTSEGRRLALRLAQAGAQVTLSVATEYGREVADNALSEDSLDASGGEDRAAATALSAESEARAESIPGPASNVQVIAARLSQEGMVELLRSGGFDYCIDATHPYAVIVTENIRAACAAAGVSHLRLVRPASDGLNGVTQVPDAAAAAALLKTGSSKILLTVGSKDLEAFTSIRGYRKRCYVRILPMTESLSKALSLGYAAANIICMQGPFDEQTNLAMLNMTGAGVLVTKDSGDIGGYAAKVQAAQKLGCEVIVITRPQAETGYTYDGILAALGVRDTAESRVAVAESRVAASDNQPQIGDRAAAVEDQPQSASIDSQPPAAPTQTSFFPLFVDLRGQKVLVIGGGAVAERRIKNLLNFHADITVVSTGFSAYIERAALQGSVSLVRRPYVVGDIESLQPLLVIAATDNRRANRAAMIEAKRLGIWVSVADSRSECSFYFPAIAENDNFIAAWVSKNGDHRGVREMAARTREMLLP